MDGSDSRKVSEAVLSKSGDGNRPKSKNGRNGERPDSNNGENGDKSAPSDQSVMTRGDDTHRAPYSEAVKKPTGGTENFQVMGPNNGKRPNKGVNKDNNKTPEMGAKNNRKVSRIGGTAEESGILRAGPSNFQLQITNVSPTLSDEDISVYIEGKSANIKPLKIEDTTSEGWSTKRFLITFDYKYCDTIMSEDFWPRRIYFKRWFPRAKMVNNK